MITKRFWLIIFSVLILLVGLTMGLQRARGAYPASLVLRYAGLVKPQPAPDYVGDCGNEDFSLCYLGAYVINQTEGLHNDEGGGSHPGVDIISNRVCAQTQIKAVAGGEIIEIRRNWRDLHPGLNACGDNLNETPETWGNYVIVRHAGIPVRDGYGGEDFYTIYAHLFSVAEGIEVGQKVLRGTVLGTLGSTGNSTGPHLHFQMDKTTWNNHPYWPTVCVQGLPEEYSCTADTLITKARSSGIHTTRCGLCKLMKS